MKIVKSINYLGAGIKALREEKGIKAAELARIAKLPPSTIYGLEGGINKSPGFELICIIADTLGVSLDWLREYCKKYKKPCKGEV